MEGFGRGAVTFLTKLDAFSDRLLKPLSKVFCYLTGRSNFALARGSIVVGMAVMAAADLRDFVNAPTSFWGAFTLVVVMPYWAWLTRRTYRFYGQIERALEQSTGELNVDMREMMNYAFNRLFLNLFLLMSPPGLILLRPTSWGFAFWISSLYFAMQFNHGGKSVVRKAVEKAKVLASKAAEKARDLVPQPQPVPVPIGA